MKPLPRPAHFAHGAGASAPSRAEKNPEIGIAPYRSFAVFELAGANALHDEVAAHSVFLASRHVAQSRASSVPFAVFGHSTFLNETLKSGNARCLHGRRRCSYSEMAGRLTGE
jgi:hypothetical protein